MKTKHLYLEPLHRSPSILNPETSILNPELLGPREEVTLHRLGVIWGLGFIYEQYRGYMRITERKWKLLSRVQGLGWAPHPAIATIGDNSD